MKLRNLVTNPSFETGTAGWEPQAALSVTRVAGEGRDGGAAARLLRFRDTAGGDVAGYNTSGLIVGETYTVSAWFRRETTESTSVSLLVRTAGQFDVLQVLETDQWTRLSRTFTAASTSAVVYIGVRGQAPTDRLPVLADQVQLAEGELSPYFDGDTPDTPLRRYQWDDTPHASTSTATITTINAHLLDTGAPNPVQIVVQDLAPGSEYTIRGHRGDFTWTVPGGTGTSDGTQIVLIDNRAPLNAPITYTLTVAGASISTDPLTVTHQDKFIIQSLDGKTQVEYVWSDNGLPRDRPVNSATFNIPGRRRPVIRYETGNDGGGTLEIRTTKENTHHLNQILETGRPIVLRTDGAVRDLDAVETLLITGASNQLWAGDGGTSTQRVWTLDYILIDDPEPNTVVTAWTWAQFNEIYTGQTWADFNAEWAGAVWADFNTYDWGQRLP